MSLSLAIAVFVAADLALLAALAFVMSRAKLLTPHVAGDGGVGSAASAGTSQPPSAPQTRAPRAQPRQAAGTPRAPLATPAAATRLSSGAHARKAPRTASPARLVAVIE
jgi:hypothetical protein